MPKRDYTRELLDAIAAAKRGGWRVVNKNTVSFTTEHATPASTPEDWWPGKTYTRVTFLSFIPRQGTAPAVVLGETRTPWTGRTDRSISFKRALEILQHGRHPGN